jgi:chromate transporter
MQAAFYGVAAAVIGIIVRSAWKLLRLSLGQDRLLWAIAGSMGLVTAWTETEIGSLFILCGVLVLLLQAPPRRLFTWTGSTRSLSAVGWPLLVLTGVTAGATPGVLAQILWFFTKAGAFVFGSGLAIVPFLYGGVVQEYRWLTDQAFLDAVAVAMLTPGPVVITVAFIGYLVAGLAGGTAAAVGVFLPTYLFVVVPYRWFDRFGENTQVKAFVTGVTAAAAGAIAGACVVLGRRAIFDLPTALIALAAFGVVWRLKVPEPILIAAAGVTGLLIVQLRGGP